MTGRVRGRESDFRQYKEWLHYLRNSTILCFFNTRVRHFQTTACLKKCTKCLKKCTKCHRGHVKNEAGGRMETGRKAGEREEERERGMKR